MNSYRYRVWFESPSHYILHRTFVRLDEWKDGRGWVMRDMALLRYDDDDEVLLRFHGKMETDNLTKARTMFVLLASAEPEREEPEPEPSWLAKAWKKVFG